MHLRLAARRAVAWAGPSAAYRPPSSHRSDCVVLGGDLPRTPASWGLLFASVPQGRLSPSSGDTRHTVLWRKNRKRSCLLPISAKRGREKKLWNCLLTIRPWNSSLVFKHGISAWDRGRPLPSAVPRCFLLDFVVIWIQW
jgi:hypothetical protein